MLSRSASSTFVQPRSSRSSATQFFISSSEDGAPDAPREPCRRHADRDPERIESREAYRFEKGVAAGPERCHCSSDGERLQQACAMVVGRTAYPPDDRDDDERHAQCWGEPYERADGGVVDSRSNCHRHCRQRKVDEKRDEKLNVI